MPPWNDRGLARRKHIKQQKIHIWIICEGENTEPGYFDAVRKLYPDANCHRPIPGGKPGECVARAMRLRKDLIKEGKWRSGDQIWVVFDRDTHGCFDAAIAQCPRNSFHVGRSNPCFELWLILHVEECQRACCTDEAERHLELKRPDYERRGTKTMDFDTLVKDVEMAEARAEKLLELNRRDGDEFRSPSTTVHHLTQAIRAAHQAWKR
jgi:hypothetical protein